MALAIARKLVAAVLSVVAGLFIGSAFILAAFVACGCSSLRTAKAATNGLGLGLEAAAPVLVLECVEPLEAVTPATPAAEAGRVVAAVESNMCVDAVLSYDAGRDVHKAARATIRAVEAGRCAGVSRSSAPCDLDRRTIEALDATARVACQIERLTSGPGVACAMESK